MIHDKYKDGYNENGTAGLFSAEGDEKTEIPTVEMYSPWVIVQMQVIRVGCRPTISSGRQSIVIHQSLRNVCKSAWFVY